MLGELWKQHLKWNENSRSFIKHAIHCCGYLTLVVVVQSFTNSFLPPFVTNSLEFHSNIVSIIWNLLMFIPFLTMPYLICNFLGVMIYNAFPCNVQLKGSPLLAPFISFRVVTKGDYPNLIKRNITRNVRTCLNVGIENFLFEIVTEKDIGLTNHSRIRNIVVPFSYKTKSGALFKARNLQYCLEEDINILSNGDWIVHLDEDTIITEDSLKGIINFILEGKHQFGQGVITFANENIVNWMTTLTNFYKIGDDFGRLRFQFKVFHSPVFGWKGSYMVCQFAAERQVSFDHGPDGSITEDVFFAMVANDMGFTFDFIEGEMRESIPLTLCDIFQQRKRWLYGAYLVVRSPLITMKSKINLACVVCAWYFLPLNVINYVLTRFLVVKNWMSLDIVNSLQLSNYTYMYLFGFIKSFSLNHLGVFKFVFCLIGALCVVPLSILIELAVVVLTWCEREHKFYVVKKS